MTGFLKANSGGGYGMMQRNGYGMMRGGGWNNYDNLPATDANGGTQTPATPAK
jgi:hypothetical protein